MVAISFGGWWRSAALRHPQKVRKLVLCCLLRRRQQRLYPLHGWALAPARFAAKVAVTDLRHDAAWQARQGERLTPAWEDLQWRNARRVSNAALLRSALQLAARRDHDCYDDLPGLTMPTLLCAGRWWHLGQYGGAGGGHAPGDPSGF